MSRPVRHGFVLLEAAAALLVVGVCAAAALELYAAQTRAERALPAITTAEALAQDRLAAMRLLTAEQLRRLPDSIARGRYAPPLADFHWRGWTAAARVENDLYDLRVEITWTGGSLSLGTRQYAASTRSAR